MGASLFQRADFTQLVTAARASTVPLVFLPNNEKEGEDSASSSAHSSNSDVSADRHEMGVSADAIIRAFFATPSPNISQAKSSTPDEAAAVSVAQEESRGGGECLGRSEKRSSPSEEESGGCAQCGAMVASQQGNSSSSNARLSACARCKKVYYCGRACQAAHWKAGHKKTCVLADA